LSALSTLGKSTLQELEGELSQDNTATGQKAFALARAALPDASNKALMWKEMVETDNMSNAILESASRGFTRVRDTQVLLPYVDKYLESALEIWETKSFSIAEYLLLNLYPIEIANMELRDKTAKTLENPKVQSKAALRRILIEHLANLDRALACQKRMEK
jgi:aminopeptidase N